MSSIATAATSTWNFLAIFSHQPNTYPTVPKHFSFSPSNLLLRNHNSNSFFSRNPQTNLSRFSANALSSFPVSTTDYEFVDGSSEVELRLKLGGRDIKSPKDVFVDANGTNLTVRLQHSNSPVTLIDTNCLFDRVKAAETIWYIDEDELVVNLKKQDQDLKWPDIMESWESLTAGSSQLLKGASVYIIGESTDINEKVARELAVGIGYTPLSTKDLLESFAKQTIDSWSLAEGTDSVAESEGAILESLSSHVRTVVSTLGGPQGAAQRADRWRHLYAGFTVWLSQTEAIDEDSAKEEARKNVEDGRSGYSKSDVVVKFQGWDADYTKSLAQACLSALKQLISSDKKLPDKKSLYIRLGCRGDWPNIKPPGWDPSTGDDGYSS